MRLAYVVGVLGLLLSSTAAHAVSITNRDDHDHKVTIIEGDTRTDHVLKPSQVLTGVCAKGCTVRSERRRGGRVRARRRGCRLHRGGYPLLRQSGYAGHAAGAGNRPQSGAKRLEIPGVFRAPTALQSGTVHFFVQADAGASAMAAIGSVAVAQVGPKLRSNVARSARSNPSRPACRAESGKAGGGRIGDAAGDDAREMLEVRRHVDAEAVRAHPAAQAHADGGDLGVPPVPGCRAPRRRPGRRASLPPRRAWPAHRRSAPPTPQRRRARRRSGGRRRA